MKKGIQLLVYKESSGGRNSETSLPRTGAVTGPLGKANTVCLVTGCRAHKTTYKVFLPKELKMNLIKSSEFTTNFHLQKMQSREEKA